jgi:hypothetical protein
MGSAQPATFLIIPFALSSTNIPKFPYPTFSILPIIPLCHPNHPEPSPASQMTYYPALPQITYPAPSNTNTNQLKAEPPPPPQQAQEPLQQTEHFPTHDTIFTITRGSNIDFETKRQRRNYYRQANHDVVEGPVTQTKWSHMPITFSSQDINLISFPHTNAMVVTIHMDRWDVTKILVANEAQPPIERTFSARAARATRSSTSNRMHKVHRSRG